MFRKLTNPDSGLMIAMSQVTDCIFLSLFWLLCSFPVLTLGASSAALYHSVSRGLRKGDKHSWQLFFSGFRRNLKESILPTLVFLALLIPGLRGLIGLWNAAAAGDVSWMWFSAGGLAGVLGLGILSVLFPLLSRFENPLGRLLKNTLLLALANLPRTLALGALNAGIGYLCLRYVFPLFFLPALGAFLGSFLLEPMFRPYGD